MRAGLDSGLVARRSIIQESAELVAIMTLFRCRGLRKHSEHRCHCGVVLTHSSKVREVPAFNRDLLVHVAGTSAGAATTHMVPQLLLYFIMLLL